MQLMYAILVRNAPRKHVLSVYSSTHCTKQCCLYVCFMHLTQVLQTVSNMFKVQSLYLIIVREVLIYQRYLNIYLIRSIDLNLCDITYVIAGTSDCAPFIEIILHVQSLMTQCTLAMFQRFNKLNLLSNAPIFASFKQFIEQLKKKLVKLWCHSIIYDRRVLAVGWLVVPNVSQLIL